MEVESPSIDAVANIHGVVTIAIGMYPVVTMQLTYEDAAEAARKIAAAARRAEAYEVARKEEQP